MLIQPIGRGITQASGRMLEMGLSGWYERGEGEGGYLERVMREVVVCFSWFVEHCEIVEMGWVWWR